MDPKYREMIDFLKGLGTEQIQHSGDKRFLAHLVAVCSDLQNWGCNQDLCRAGLFHSIYGTELFRRFSLPLTRRGDVQALIGERAERLAFANCMMDRGSFDALLESAGPFVLRHRETAGAIELSAEDYEDLVRLHLCDWLEQVARSERWAYRRKAYGKMADRLGGVALDAYERVFAGAPVAAGT